MKKILCLLMSFALLLSFCSCSKEESSQPGNTTISSFEAEEIAERIIRNILSANLNDATVDFGEVSYEINASGDYEFTLKGKVFYKDEYADTELEKFDAKTVITKYGKFSFDTTEVTLSKYEY